MSSTSATDGNDGNDGDDGWKGGGPVGSGGYVVLPGDCIESIAALNGFHWQTLWDHAGNAELRQRRKDPFLLLPGDKLHIPEKRVVDFSRATDKSHWFVLKSVPSRIAFVLKAGFKPRPGVRYRLEIDGDIISGTTGSDGKISATVKPGAKHANLSLPNTGEHFQIPLGHLDPIEEPSGVQGRLQSLGFYDGPLDGVASPSTLNALYCFQEIFKHSDNLEPTGKLDADTLKVLKREYGS